MWSALRADPESKGSDYVYLDSRVFGETRSLDGRACRRRRREVRAVHLVDDGEVVHVGEVHGGRKHSVERRPPGLQDFPDVVEDLARLRLDAPFDQVPGRRVQGDLTGEKEEVTCPNSLGVRPNRRRRRRSGNGLSHEPVRPIPDPPI